MKQRTVRIQFEGEVTVNVSEHLSDEDAEALANHLALARVVATTHNPDAPEAEAYDDLVEACPNITEADWDTATCELIGGSWSVPLPPATPPQFPVFVVAGSDTTVAEIGQDAIAEYHFVTEAERKAFLQGLDAHDGWLECVAFDTREEAEAHVAEVMGEPDDEED